MTDVLLVVDVEPDDFFVDPGARPPWRGFEIAVERLAAWRERARTRHPATRLTWTVRADTQIAHTYGDAGWGHATYDVELDRLRDDGDEIGVHVHCYRPSPSNRWGWVEDYGDPAWVERNVRESVAVHRRHRGATPRVMSMGADWIDHATVALADELGVEVEMTLIAENLMRQPRLDDSYAGSWPDARHVADRVYRPDMDDFLQQDSDTTMQTVHCLPQTAAPVPFETRLRDGSPGELVRALGGAAARRIGLRPRTRPVYKLYLSSPWQQIATALRRAGSTADGYVTIIIDSRQFSDPERLAVIDDNLERLLQSRLTRGARFSTVADVVGRPVAPVG